MPINAYEEPRSAADRIVLERGRKRTIIRLPRHGVAVLLGLSLLLTGWSLAAAAYVVFHDTVVAELRRGADVSRRGYEAQIATLKSELERTRTRRMVENTGVDQRIAALGVRQAAIEKRQERLAALADASSSDEAELRDPAFTYSLKPAPLEGAEHALDGQDPDPVVPARRESSLKSTEKVEAALDAMDVAQGLTLEGFARKTSDRLATLGQVYDAAGVSRPNQKGDGRGRGGPFEPLPARATTFEGRAEQVVSERALVASFERGLNRVPIRTPSPGSPLSSNFGARMDPFLGRPAFHSGLDFDADLASPVKVTAAGRVISAGWSGGYGNMVEVDHGGGLTTRYGHMSLITVLVGDEVTIGSTVGRVGSTGRSTGPHLHYETRMNGDAVNPLRFLNAGRLLVAKR